MGFFQGFNFDTVLAIISCITGIVALFLGGTAYKNCKIIILLENKSEKEINVEYNCYFITTAATELQKIASYIPNKGYFDYFCDKLKKEYEKTICISLHKVAETDG